MGLEQVGTPHQLPVPNNFRGSYKILLVSLALGPLVIYSCLVATRDTPVPRLCGALSLAPSSGPGVLRSGVSLFVTYLVTPPGPSASPPERSELGGMRRMKGRFTTVFRPPI